MRTDEREFYARLGRLVKELRQARQLTQDQLAERLQLRRTSITNIELGTQGVSGYSLVRLAEALGADPGELLDTAATPSEAGVEVLLAHSVSDVPLKTWVRTITQDAAKKHSGRRSSSTGAAQ